MRTYKDYQNGILEAVILLHYSCLAVMKMEQHLCY